MRCTYSIGNEPCGLTREEHEDRTDRMFLRLHPHAFAPSRTRRKGYGDVQREMTGKRRDYSDVQ